MTVDLGFGHDTSPRDKNLYMLPQVGLPPDRDELAAIARLMNLLEPRDVGLPHDPPPMRCLEFIDVLEVRLNPLPARVGAARGEE